MHIHFVCSFNATRSRIAEAYARSKGVEGLTVSSSGTHARPDGSDGLSGYARRVLDKHNLYPFASSHSVKTDRSTLESCDLVICMEKDNQEYIQSTLSYQSKAVECWNIIDLSSFYMRDLFLGHSDEMVPTIMKRVDDLLSRISV